MRIVLVVPEFGDVAGGIATWYAPLVKRWAATAEVLVLSGAATVSAPDETPRSLPGGGRCVPLGRERLARWRARFARYGLLPELQGHLGASWAMRELALEHRPDVVEVCDYGLLFAPWVAAPCVPTVVQLHGSCGQIARHDPIRGDSLQAALLQAIETTLIAHAPSVQTCSTSNALAWAESSSVRAEVCLPALEFDVPGPSAPQCTTPAADAPFRVFGRLQQWKGPTVVAACLRDPGLDGVGVEWYGRDTVVSRPGHFMSAQLAAEHPEVFGRRLRWAGPVPAARVRSLQAGALANLVPSVWDVFNLTAAEAMLAGRPVIVSRGAGAAELVEHGRNGLVCEAGDAAGLAEAMRTVLGMTESRRLALAAAAAETVRARLDPDRAASVRLDGFERLRREQAVASAPLAAWIRELVEPDRVVASPRTAALDRLPLAELTRYLTRRLLARVAPARLRS